jgi:peptide chain release factor subunit 1
LQGRVFDVDQTKEKFICELLIPPLPIKRNVYRCDRRFYTEFLIDLFEDYQKFGLIMISGEETQFFNITGTSCILIDRFTLHRQKSMKAGGQSAQRFNRIQQNQVDEYVKKICERIRLNFLSNGLSNNKGVIVTGVGDVKDRLLTSDFLPDVKIIKTLTLSKIDLNIVLESCNDLLFQGDAQEEQKVLEKITNMFHTDINKLVYGFEVLRKDIEEGKVKEIIFHIKVEKEFGLEWIKKVEDLGGKTTRLKTLNKNNLELIQSYGGVLGIRWYEEEEKM